MTASFGIRPSGLTGLECVLPHNITTIVKQMSRVSEKDLVFLIFSCWSAELEINNCHLSISRAFFILSWSKNSRDSSHFRVWFTFWKIMWYATCTIWYSLYLTFSEVTDFIHRNTMKLSRIIHLKNEWFCKQVYLIQASLFWYEIIHMKWNIQMIRGVSSLC